MILITANLISGLRTNRVSLKEVHGCPEYHIEHPGIQAAAGCDDHDTNQDGCPLAEDEEAQDEGTDHNDAPHVIVMLYCSSHSEVTRGRYCLALPMEGVLKSAILPNN